jgi:hypothetical protein
LESKVGLPGDTEMNEEPYDFNKQNDMIREKTEMFERWLKTTAGTSGVENVEGVKRFQEADIDFKQLTDDGNTTHVELKVCFKIEKFKNVAYETMSNIEYRTIGCFLKTKSDIVYYMNYHTNDVHLIDPKKMLDYFFDNRKRFYTNGSRKEIPNKARNGKDTYHSEIFAISLKELQDAGLVEETIAIPLDA